MFRIASIFQKRCIRDTTTREGASGALLLLLSARPLVAWAGSRLRYLAQLPLDLQGALLPG